MTWTEERRKKRAEDMAKLWKTRRAELIEKQKRLGLRTYPHGNV